jgi:hypothetical protein
LPKTHGRKGRQGSLGKHKGAGALFFGARRKANLVIAMAACRVSLADQQKNPQGARKVFMPHIGGLWEASSWGWGTQFWRWLFATKG